MDIAEATEDYEAWVEAQIPIDRKDLKKKHDLMGQDPFAFFRGTFYRWAQIFPELCPDLMKAPEVLGVGDPHLENYGTWRDAEGRLVWGINDFDEAYHFPYTLDLVRLSVSASLAIEIDKLSINPNGAAQAILKGYEKNIYKNGKAFVLSDKHTWLRDAVSSRARDPVKFWEKLNDQPKVKEVPEEVLGHLKKALPTPDVEFDIVHRLSGVGSLGRERYTALADWQGGKIAREAKRMIPSAWPWSVGKKDERKLFITEILSNAVRSPDPFLKIQGNWLLRRLSPYCSRIRLSQLPNGLDQEKLLVAMGREIANIHLGSASQVEAIRQDLSARQPHWLMDATKIMAEAVMKDWNEWRK
jgi:hypothetical protein